MRYSLKAGVLSFTIYVSIVVAMLLLMLILYAYYSNLEKANNRISIRLLGNLSSAEQWVLSQGDQLPYGEEYMFDLFGNGTDSVSVTRQPWGLYDQYQVYSFFRHQKKISKFMMGSQLAAKGRSVIYLQDQSQGLQLVGDTHIQGDVYLPDGKVRSAYINRIGYTRNQLVYGTISKSEKKMPTLVAVDRFKEFERYAASLPHAALYSEKDKVSHSFWSDSLMVMEVGDYRFEDTMEGYIFINSSGTVILDRSAHCRDIIVSANQIHFEEGFTGQGQFFASDTIIVEKGVELSYPSVLFVENSEKPATIEIREAAQVSGTIIMAGAEDNFTDRLISVEDQAEINGTIYCNGYLTTFGEHNGHVLTRKFLINSFSGIFENYVMNAAFRNDLDSGFLVPNSWFMKDKKGILQWLY
ncbi:MAG: hypothetical protein ABJF04_23075 [Reichenbachiella sp.]|uniref:hypothetical protein n=1 Tax=Reichenbachiella sp. TaxID=2184521 RepID=UPI0032641ACB